MITLSWDVNNTGLLLCQPYLNLFKYFSKIEHSEEWTHWYFDRSKIHFKNLSCLVNWHPCFDSLKLSAFSMYNNAFSFTDFELWWSRDCFAKNISTFYNLSTDWQQPIFGWSDQTATPVWRVEKEVIRLKVQTGKYRGSNDTWSNRVGSRQVGSRSW